MHLPRAVRMALPLVFYCRDVSPTRAKLERG
jgi:hypothetical protein